MADMGTTSSTGSGTATGAMMTPEMQQKIQTLLNDPVNGPKLMAIINNPNSSMSPLGSAATAIGKQSTPSGQIGAGLGAGAALGLKALLNKKPQAPSNVVSGGYNDNSAMGGMDPTESDTPIGDMAARRGGIIKSKRKFASGGEAPPGMPKKRGVLVRRPILSTTIVIAKKPKTDKKEKAEKKARGGPIQAKKPAAVPPRHGPGNGATPAPFKKGGHVQVPRGSGVAQRGKQFRGIF